MIRNLSIEILAFLLILLFLYASTNKILDYQKFSIQIGQSPLLTGFGGIIPWLVITIEWMVSVALFIPRLRLYGFFASFCLMVMFTAYIVSILHFSTFIPCSCGGVLEKLSWNAHLIFNIGFVGVSLAGILLQAHVQKPFQNSIH